MSLKMSESHPIFKVKATSDGRLFSTITGREIGKKGQHTITVRRRDNGAMSSKTRKHLVLESFQVENPHGWWHVRHVNGDLNDCRLSNLRWTKWDWFEKHVNSDGDFCLRNVKDNTSFYLYFNDIEKAENFSKLDGVKSAMIKYDTTCNWEELQKEILKVFKNFEK